MADLMDEDMADQRVEILAGLAPVVEDGTAVKKDPVGLGPRVAHALAWQGHAAIEAEDVEGAVELHLHLGLGVGELVDADHDAAQMPLQFRRDSAQRALGKRFEVGNRRRQTWRCGHGFPSGRRLISRPLPATGEGRRSSDWWARRASPRSRNAMAGSRPRTAMPSARSITSAP